MRTAGEGFWEVSNEFRPARLPDKRLLRRIEAVMQARGMRPGASFPDALGSEICGRERLPGAWAREGLLKGALGACSWLVG